MDYRKDNWKYELECVHKAVCGEQDGFRIEISPHYTVDRLENPDYPDRVWVDIDIAAAILTGTIIAGYSSAENRNRKSRVHGLVTPTRLILGEDRGGNMFIVVVGFMSSRYFNVVTCYPADRHHLKRAEDLKKM